MPDPSDLQARGNWDGGFYELGLALRTRDDAALGTAAAVLWRAAGVVGEGPPEDVAMGERPRGVLTLPSGARTVAQLYAMTGMEPGEIDWLCLGLPLAAFARTDRRVRGFPFGADGGDPSLEWRQVLDDWLLAICRTVAGEIPVRLGAVGFELPYDEVAATADSADREAPRAWSVFVPGADPECLPATY